MNKISAYFFNQPAITLTEDDDLIILIDLKERAKAIDFSCFIKVGGKKSPKSYIYKGPTSQYTTSYFPTMLQINQL
jgi:hypothetical protein